MARAREVPDLECEELFALSAARVIDARAEEMLAHSERVLDLGDIERLHDMRVATRRLRAAMEVFRPCFPRKRLRSALREVKVIADALGERRDLDVSIEALDAISLRLTTADRRGVAVLRERLREEQRSANQQLEPFVTESRLRDLCEDLNRLAASARRLARSKESAR